MKENVKTVFLALLLITTLFLAANLWMSPFNKNKNVQISDNNSSTKHFFDEIFFPQKTIVNIGEKNHRLLYNSGELWKKHSKAFGKITEEVDREDALLAITLEEYMNLHNAKSIIFKFKREFKGRVLINFLNLKIKEKTILKNMDISEIYFSAENPFIVIGNSKGYFKIDLKSYDYDNVRQSVEKVELDKEDIEYINFYEKYNILKNIYIPLNKEVDSKSVNYINGLKDIEKIYKKNLVERFLDQDIEYIKEITEKEGTIFVYENKVLKLNYNGLLEYKNLEEFEIKDRNLFISLKAAIEFIYSKSGLSNHITISKISPIEEKGNLGYRFEFNYVEDYIPVVLINENKVNSIVVDIYNKEIKNLKLYYRRAEDSFTGIKYEEMEIKNLDEVIALNIKHFYSEEEVGADYIRQTLSNIQDCNIVYIDENNETKPQKLIPAWQIKFPDKIYYFDLESGKYLTER